MKDYLLKTGSTWIFNSPCSSHIGGAWERMIGSTRRILDSMLSKIHEGNLTHDVLATFMTEVSATFNNRPLVSVSTDAATPFILTPATLLTQKTPSACVARNLKSLQIQISTSPSGNVYKRSLTDFRTDGRENTCLLCITDGNGRTLAQIRRKTWCCSETNPCREISGR